MKAYSNPDEMLCGLYALETENREQAAELISKFAHCPNWPIVQPGFKENEVFVLAVELKRQCHGDFSEGNNTLVKNPGLVGAMKVRFVRIHNVRELVGSYEFRTGYADRPPCGADCAKCPVFQNPCQGCPAQFEL